MIVLMYRPTVRYDEAFWDYVNALLHATNLDRNQILRAALFTAAYSREFHELLRPYREKDVNANITGARETKKDNGNF